MTLARLTRGDVIAAVAALSLLLVMSLDWYGTATGDDARRIQEQVEPRENGVGSGAITRGLEETARITAENEEKTAWQAYGFTDLVLFAAAVLALLAAFARAAGKRFDPPASPSGMAAIVGAVGALLVAYRIVQEPGNDNVTTVKFGVFLGLLAVTALTLGALSGLKAEQDGSAWAEPEQRAEPEPDAEPEAEKAPA